jgi:hypothetical protein
MYHLKTWKRAKQTACAETFVAAGREFYADRTTTHSARHGFGPSHVEALC